MKTQQERAATFKKVFNTALELASKCDWDEPGITTLLASNNVKEALRLFDEEGIAWAKEQGKGIDRVQLAFELVKTPNFGSLDKSIRDATQATLVKYLTDD